MRRHIAPTVLLLAAALSQACFLLPRSARPDMTGFFVDKDKMIRSFTMKTIDIFYPSDRDPARRPGVSTAQTGALRQGLQSAADTIRSAHGRIKSQLDSALGQKLRAPAGVVRLTDKWEPLAYGTGDTVFMDTRVVHSILRAAVISTWRDTRNDPFARRRAAPANAGDTSDAAVLPWLRRLRDDVHGMTGTGFWGGVKSIFSDDFSSFDNDDIEKQFRQVANRNAAGTLFVIAHELGHRALGHDTLPIRKLEQENCPRRQDLEFEADRYATLLTLFSFVPLGMTSFGFSEDQVELEAMIGNREFLGIAYDVAGFMDVGGRCPYPPAAERAAATTAVYRAAKQNAGNLFEPATFGDLVRAIQAVPLRGR